MLTYRALHRPCKELCDKLHGTYFKRRFSTQNGKLTELLTALRQLDTAALCDADKGMIADGDDYQPLSLLEGLRPLNHSGVIMVGVARTVQCLQPNDFLAVLDGLQRAEPNEVFMVNTLPPNSQSPQGTQRAVAGELFCAEASRRGLAGIIVEGAMRDTGYLNEHFGTPVRCYARSVTPYSGTTIHLGQEQIPITCGGVEVKPGDIVMGDDDGILVGEQASFETLLDVAQKIKATEDGIKFKVVKEGKSLHSMTNCESHVTDIRAGKESILKFL